MCCWAARSVHAHSVCLVACVVAAPLWNPPAYGAFAACACKRNFVIGTFVIGTKAVGVPTLPALGTSGIVSRGTGTGLVLVLSL